MRTEWMAALAICASCATEADVGRAEHELGLWLPDAPIRYALDYGDEGVVRGTLTDYAVGWGDDGAVTVTARLRLADDFGSLDHVYELTAAQIENRVTLDLVDADTGVPVYHGAIDDTELAIEHYAPGGRFRSWSTRGDLSEYAAVAPFDPFGTFYFGCPPLAADALPGLPLHRPAVAALSALVGDWRLRAPIACGPLVRATNDYAFAWPLTVRPLAWLTMWADGEVDDGEEKPREVDPANPWGWPDGVNPYDGESCDLHDTAAGALQTVSIPAGEVVDVGVAEYRVSLLRSKHARITAVQEGRIDATLLPNCKGVTGALGYRLAGDYWALGACDQSKGGECCLDHSRDDFAALFRLDAGGVFTGNVAGASKPTDGTGAYVRLKGHTDVCVGLDGKPDFDAKGTADAAVFTGHWVSEGMPPKK